MGTIYSPSRVAAELKDLRDALETANKRIADLSHVMERLAGEVQHRAKMSSLEVRRVEDKDANERRILTLELEKTLLTFERRLPLPPSKE